MYFANSPSPAEGIYPEEDCATGVIEFKAKRGAPDETQE
jgi:hypothetical protein